jgi:hypothetical protein
MYRSFIELASDVICRGHFKKRMEATQGLRSERAPGAGAQTLDAREAR